MAHSLVQQVKNHLPVQESQETGVQSLGQEDPLEEGWQPTPVFLPEKYYGHRSLAGYMPQGHKESDMTEHTHTCTAWRQIRLKVPQKDQASRHRVGRRRSESREGQKVTINQCTHT